MAQTPYPAESEMNHVDLLITFTTCLFLPALTPRVYHLEKVNTSYVKV